MVWAAGGAPRLLVPAGLIDRLRDDQFDALLVHELAHLRRRDHWVRDLEFFALGLYWWNPVVWWARRALREAEEQCCDAWVVSVLEGSRRTYAEALVETLDFLSLDAPAPRLLASGIGPVTDLKRRLTMILSGTTHRAMTWTGSLLVLGLGGLLPLVPAWVRAEPPPAADRKADDPRPDGREPNVFFLQADDRDSPEARRLEEELRKKSEEIQKLAQRLRALREQGGAPADGGPKFLFRMTGTPEEMHRMLEAHRGDKPTIAIRVAPEGAIGKPDTVAAFKIGERGIVLRGPGSDMARPAGPGRVLTFEAVPGEGGVLILRPVAEPGADRPGLPRIRVLMAGPNAQPVIIPDLPRPPAAPPGPCAEPAGRAQDLEKRLDGLIHEMEKLRRDIHGSQRSDLQLEMPEIRLKLAPAPKRDEQADEARQLKELQQREAELDRTLQAVRKLLEERKARKEAQPK